MRNDPGDDGLSLQVVVFSAGGCRFAIEAGEVAAMRCRSGVEECPDIETLLGLPRDGNVSRRLLEFRNNGVVAAIPGDAALSHLPARTIHALPPLLAARIAVCGAAALALDADGPVLIVDPRQFPCA
ncbi:hypothetical protein [Telmatospirillum sp.]|uniref:hypothetical protein n=1 Tax=Telmatospirillum sp. TaxID=2079197 RepID=UPI002845CCAD|nr:hypothetical protein [Telmatospirillum sp.]MDR3437366.1 hypothetical protein [Telmatospirillum sp.]